MLTRSLRSWRQTRLLALQSILTIALGMGGVSAILSLMLELGYQPLPFRDPSQLVVVWERVDSGSPVAAISGPDLVDFGAGTAGVFASLGAFLEPRFWLTDDSGRGQQITACYIEADAFAALGMRPVFGRGVRPDDLPAGTGATAPAWISARLWHDRYGGSHAVIGRMIGLASGPTESHALHYRIVGVLPEGASIPLPSRLANTDVWFILSNRMKARRPRSAGVFFGVGRLRPGIGVAQSQAALTAIASRLGQEYAGDRRNLPVVGPLELMVQGPARRTTGALALGVAFVLLLGCANVGILMVAEGGRRRRELAIRAALGAGRWRLWKDVAAEQVLAMLLSVVAGVPLAYGLLRGLARLVPAAGLGPPLTQTPSLKIGVLLVTGSLLMLAALAWSVLLVRAAVGQRAARVLTAGSPGDSDTSDNDPRSGRWRLILLTSQAAVGICLVASAATAAKTYAELSTADLGPDPSGTVLLSIQPSDGVVLTTAQAADFNQQILARLGRLPGIRTIALADTFPPFGAPVTFRKETDEPDTVREATLPDSVSNEYFRALGIPILFGRGFDDTDRTGAEPVAIVNLEMAARNWPAAQQAVGSRIQVGADRPQRYRVVGVAANFNGYWARAAVPTVFVSQTQSPTWGGEIILRTAGSSRVVEALARQALTGMVLPATVSDVSTFRARWEATAARPRARMAGMLLLALVGLALAMQAIYAVAEATVTARGRDLAVCSALGAPAGQLIWAVLRGSLLAMAIGATLGAVAAANMAPILHRWLGPATAPPIGAIAAAVVLLAIAAAAGSYLPSRRLIHIDVVEALRRG